MKCTKCNKQGAYVRLRTWDMVCRQCGAIIPLPEPEMKEVPTETMQRVKEKTMLELDKQTKKPNACK